MEAEEGRPRQASSNDQKKRLIEKVVRVFITLNTIPLFSLVALTIGFVRYPRPTGCSASVSLL